MKHTGQERRIENRYAFFGDLPGVMQHAETQESISFLPVDISRKGLGLFLHPCPAEGEIIIVKLEFQEQALRFRVRHIYKGSRMTLEGFESMQRCGVELVDDSADIDLVEIFTRYSSVVITD